MNLFFICFAILFCEGKYFYADEDSFSYYGRFDATNPQKPLFDWSSSYIITKFSGTTLSILIDDTNHNNFFNVYVDGVKFTFGTSSNETEYPILFNGDNGVTFHELVIYKRTEAMLGPSMFLGVKVDGDLKKWESEKKRKIVFYGDSLTVGYGDLGTNPCTFSHDTESSNQAYGAHVGDYFNAIYHIVAWSGKGLVRNYGEKGQLSPDPMPTYMDKICGSYSQCGLYNFSSYSPDVVSVFLGANDFSSTEYAPSKDQYINGYNLLFSNFTKKYYKDTYKNIHFFLICGDMSVSKEHPWCDYVNEVAKFWKEFIPSITVIDMTGLLDYPKDEGCDGHPNISGQQKFANHIIPIFEKVTGW